MCPILTNDLGGGGGGLLVTWISNIDYWKTGNYQINANLVSCDVTSLFSVLTNMVETPEFPNFSVETIMPEASGVCFTNG